MADDLVDHEISEQGQICVAKLQEVIAALDLSPVQAAMAVGEVFAWVHILGFMGIGKERMLAQMDRSAAASRSWAEATFDGFKARAEVLSALDAGESGGRLQ